MDQLLAIRAFSRGVEAGNFTKAADSLRMPKATVSKLVQTLEVHLGVQRTGRVLPMRFQDKLKAIELDMRHVVGVNESNAHFAAGLAGLGVIQTFSFLAQPAVDRGELVPVLTRFQPKPYPLHLAYPPNRHVSNRLRVFIDWAVEAFARAVG